MLLLPNVPLREPLLSEFPFPAATLDDATLHEVDAFFAAWGNEFGFHSEGYTVAARGYLKHCCPAAAPLEHVLVAAEYLAWYLSLNDLAPGERKRRLIDETRAIFADGAASLDAEVRAGRAFLSTLRSQIPATELARFTWRIQQMLDAFEWELDATGPGTSSRVYLENREHLIGHLPYVEMWRLLAGAPVEEHRHWPTVDAMVAHNTRIIFTTNDILSVPRDRRLGKLNLVFCLAEEQACSPKVAVEQAAEYLAHELRGYLATRDVLWQEASTNARLRRHLSFLDAVLEGNRLGVMELVSRYWGEN